MNLKDKISMYWKAIAGTVAAILSGVYISAIAHPQPNVQITNGPSITAVNASECRVDHDYARTVGGKTITVKHGFVFDGASIPDGLQWPLGLNRWSGCIVGGALIHDALYASELVSRDEADAILRSCIIEDGTEPHKAAAIWKAVHDCGAIVWSRHTGASVRAARQYVDLK